MRPPTKFEQLLYLLGLSLHVTGRAVAALPPGFVLLGMLLGIGSVAVLSVFLS